MPSAPTKSQAPTPFQRGARAARQQVFSALRRIESMTAGAVKLAQRIGQDTVADSLERDLKTLAAVRQAVRRQPMPVERKRGAR